jgi:anti-sigma-K factor RskA
MEETCQAIEAMLAEYALNTLDAAAKKKVEDHLEVCTDCRKALAEYQGIADSLLFAIPPVEPPAPLRARLLKATLPPTSDPSWWNRWRGWLPRLVLAASAAAILVLMVINISLLNSTRQVLDAHNALTQQNQAYQTAFALLTYPDSQIAIVENDQIYGTLVYDPDDDLAVLTVRGLEILPPNQDYQVWLIEPDQTRISGGVFKSIGSEEFTVFVINSPIAMESFVGVGVTVEPEGGSPGPTGSRVLGVEL